MSLPCHPSCCLPGPVLWMSIVVSAALAGSMVPHARNLPLVLYFMCITVFYHSATLVSTLTAGVNTTQYTRASFIDPLDNSHIFYTLCLGLFWLLNFVLQILNFLKRTPREDRLYFLVIFSCIEWMLNALIIYHSLLAWRDRQLARLEQEEDLEYCAEHLHLNCGDEDELTIVYLSMTGPLPPVHEPIQVLSDSELLLPTFPTYVPDNDPEPPNNEGALQKDHHEKE